MSPDKKEKNIRIPIEEIEIEGNLTIPFSSASIVIFCHGTGSSRFSPRNNYVAEILQKRGISTFLFDLLTKEEDEIYENRFNIQLLTERLVIATKYIISLRECSKFTVGYFGASTGAASALKASVKFPDTIKAVVSRGGRPDLANDIAEKVVAPTLFIVGSLDHQVIKLNQETFEILRCIKDIQIVNGASHLFEEPGTLKEVAELASDWFEKYL